MAAPYARLLEWVAGVLPTARISFELPREAIPDTEEPGGGFVALHLLSLLDRTRSRARDQTRLEFEARFLVTTGAPRPEGAADMLFALAFAATETDWLTLDLEPLPLAFWQAAGVTPRASLVVGVPVRRLREPAPVPRVSGPPTLVVVDTTSVRGQVRTADGQMAAGVEVTLQPLGRTTRTDRHGAFCFTTVPTDPALPVTITIEVRGQRFALAPLLTSAGDSRPVHIQLEPNRG